MNVLMLMTLMILNTTDLKVRNRFIHFQIVWMNLVGSLSPNNNFETNESESIERILKDDNKYTGAID